MWQMAPLENYTDTYKTSKQTMARPAIFEMVIDQMKNNIEKYLSRSTFQNLFYKSSCNSQLSFSVHLSCYTVHIDCSSSWGNVQKAQY